jgi:hypothetical protein
LLAMVAREGESTGGLCRMRASAAPPCAIG